MRADRHLKRTDLFLVRVWADDTTETGEQAEWRGRVQRVTSGETREFDGWRGLVDHLLAMFPPATALPPSPTAEAEPEGTAG